ncbi:membrane protein [Psychromicrobium lacuslunae]|uniref:Membrane protein n=1 Tax=Psychromicrobium lacuslunae TaxID=1618207 RepID=A0A0D4C302_9MICC|nr:membrane protein [Psychromicrobium lacuslunae]
MGRTRVTAQRAHAVVSAEFPVAKELDEQSGVGRLLISSLIRAQLRLSLVVGAGFLILLAAVPTALALFPELKSITLWHIPLPWLLLGAALYPVICLCAWLYTRTAKHDEETFHRLVSDQ